MTDNSVKFVDLFNDSYRLLLSVKSFKYVERVVCNVPILKLRDAETNLMADICFQKVVSLSEFLSRTEFAHYALIPQPVQAKINALIREKGQAKVKV